MSDPTVRQGPATAPTAATTRACLQAVWASLAAQPPVLRALGRALLAETELHVRQWPARRPLLDSVALAPERLYGYLGEINRGEINRGETHPGETGGTPLAPAMRRLKALRLPSGNPPDGPDGHDAPEPLFDIVELHAWRRHPGEPERALHWLVRGGQWAFWRLDAAGRRALCRLASAAVSADTRHPQAGDLAFALGVELVCGGPQPDWSQPDWPQPDWWQPDWPQPDWPQGAPDAVEAALTALHAAGLAGAERHPPPPHDDEPERDR